METVLKVGWKKIKWPRAFSGLHLASQAGKLDVVQLLCEKIAHVDADIKTKDDAGKLPEDYAIEQGHYEIAEYLQRFDLKRQKALETAAEEEHPVDQSIIEE